MFKRLIESIIKLKNPDFQFDENVELSTVVSLSISKFFAVFRSLKLIFHGKFSKNVFLGRKVKIINGKKIHWGKWVNIGDNVKISALGNKGIFFGNNVSIGDFSRIEISTSFNNIGKFIKIGDNVGIGAFAYLGGAGGLEIGNDCIVGQYLSCHPENHNYENVEEKIRLQGVSRKGIVIGENCWIGSKVTVLDGVNIGNGCIIAAGAVVTKSFPDNVIIGGVPAKILKHRTRDVLEEILVNA